MIKSKEKFMKTAIQEAEKARQEGDYAIGAVVVKDDKILSCSSSRSKRDENPIAHAEALAIIRASKILKSRHLIGCVLYTTHEPCPMCASLIVWARMKGVVYGACYIDMKKYRQKNGNKNYLWRTIDIPCKTIFQKSTERIEVVRDFMREKCIELFHNE